MRRSRRAPREEETAPAAKQKDLRRVVAGGQCRAAGAVRGWPGADLAERGERARKPIADLEMNARSLQSRTRRDITQAFEGVGIEFIWGNGPEEHHGKASDQFEGVRFSRRLAPKKKATRHFGVSAGPRLRLPLSRN